LPRAALRLAVAAFVLTAIATGVLVLWPGARHAVAGWLGLPGISIEVTDRTPTPAAGGALYLGRRSTEATADRLLHGRLAVPTGDLGPPDAVYVDGVRRVVWLVYRSSPRLPGIAAHDDVGLLVTELRAGSLDPLFYKKLVSGGAAVRDVMVDGSRGFWIHGQPHLIGYRHPSGVQGEEPGRVSGNSLIWAKEGITYRIELQADLSTALSIANSLH
jgi:hypothetical protein